MRKLEDFVNAPIYSGKIENEIEKPNNYSCFPGAWYYKALSSNDAWLGLETVVTLPYFTPDEKRTEEIVETQNPLVKSSRHLDTPSIYIGGLSDFESDLGLGWFKGMVDGKKSDKKMCYRPFYRYIYEDEQGKIHNNYEGPSIDKTQYYYFPGDKVRLKVFTVKDNYLRLSIELLEPTKDSYYSQLRSKLSKTNEVFATEDFPSFGHGIKHAEFKRVNAIDQYHNEGKPSQKTDALYENCIWEECYLYRLIDGKIKKVPFNDTRYVRMLCPDPKAFEVASKDNKEVVSIKPQKAN